MRWERSSRPARPVRKADSRGPRNGNFRWGLRERPQHRSAQLCSFRGRENRVFSFTGSKALRPRITRPCITTVLRETGPTSKHRFSPPRLIYYSGEIVQTCPTLNAVAEDETVTIETVTIRTATCVFFHTTDSIVQVPLVRPAVPARRSR